MKLFIVMLLGLILYGCGTMNKALMDTTSKKIKIGMTEKQVFDIEGSPAYRSRQVINGKTYENWRWSGAYANDATLTLDFADGILVGYGMGGLYMSQNGLEDIRDLK